MTDPVWIMREALELLQAESLAEHGGPDGLRYAGLLDSALTRAHNLFACEGITDVPRLAAAYAYAIAKNQPFVDGNKRAAFLGAALFLRLNGYELKAEHAEATMVMLGLGAGAVSEEMFAAWLQRNAVALSAPANSTAAAE